MPKTTRYITKKATNKDGLNRRQTIKGLATLGGVTLGVTALGGAVPARAQEQKTIRVWTTQGAPLQREAYDFIVSAFESEHPGIKVNLEFYSDNDAWATLTAAFAGGDLPDVVQHLSSVFTGSLFARDLLEPVTDVVEMVGEDDFTEAALDVYRNPNGDAYFATVIGTAVLSTLWYRNDLLKAEGLTAPTYFDDWLNIAKATTKGDIYGVSLPYGAVGFSNFLLDYTIQASGGWLIAPDMSVTANSPETIAALEFLKEMREYAPPGANNYSFGETLSSFVSGAAATSIYTGRTLINLHSDNPSIEANVEAAHFPYRRDGGRPFATNSFASQFIPKGAKNVEEAKLFAAFQYRPDMYVKFLHSAPGHLLPILKSVGNSPEYLNHPLLREHQSAVEVMVDAASWGGAPVKPSKDHGLILKLGDIYGANVLAGALQRVVVNGESPAAVAAWLQDEVAKIMES
jgi:multiple sugar transport system substrate-binding protein